VPLDHIFTLKHKSEPYDTPIKRYSRKTDLVRKKTGFFPTSLETTVAKVAKRCTFEHLSLAKVAKRCTFEHVSLATVAKRCTFEQLSLAKLAKMVHAEFRFSKFTFEHLSLAKVAFFETFQHLSLAKVAKIKILARIQF